MSDNNVSIPSSRNLPDGSSAIKVGLGLLLFMFVLVTLSVAQANGLFDFQMKLAKKGNPEAQFKVGEMYETGFGVKKDMAEAKNWIDKAAAQGHETANFKLLYWDLEKNGLTRDNKARVEELKAKAKAGNPQAQYYVGKMNAYGVGMKKNPEKGLEWLNKAALVGVIAAESEMVTVRESIQRQDIARKKRAEEKKRAEAKARQERERKAQIEKQKKLQAQQKKLQEQQKAQAELKAKQSKAEAEARAKANKEAAEKARIQAQKEAAARQQAEAKRREAEKQALMKKRAADEKKRKAQFESDPCSGKSARFLSTCK